MISISEDSGWKSFIDLFPDPVARYDKQYKHLYINNAVAQATQMPASELVGKSNRDLGIPNDDKLLAELEQKLQFVFDTGKATSHFTQHTFPDGIRYFYMKLIPDFENKEQQQGSVESVWAITWEITQLKQTELKLQEARKELEKQNMELNQANADLDTFFHTVAHDLRNPLNSIKGIVQLLKSSNQEKIPAYIGLLEKSIQRFDGVFTGLVQVLELNNAEERVEEIELEELFQQVLVEFEKAIQETNTSITSNFSACPGLRYIRPYVESLFRNMISNGIKYRSEAHLPQLHIIAERENGFVKIQFRDNGRGMDLEQSGEKIFSPFYQIDPAQEGKGMGLHIVKKILERNGGKIVVRSQPNLGTTFICYIKEMEGV